MRAAAHAVPLDRLQRWFQSVVVHPASTDEAIASPEAQAEIPAERLGEVILPSPTLSSAERIDIYHGMYLLRMEEALASDYEALKHFLGDHGFWTLVADYVQAYPSRSHTLNRLGDHLPEFLRNHPKIVRRDFCCDLARLELAVSDVFDAEETPALTDADIAAVPPEAWERARLLPIAGFRLLDFRYPVNAYLQSVRDEDHGGHPKPKLKSERVVVFRKNYAVYRQQLARPAFELLSDLAQGARLGEAIAAALARGKRAPQEDELFRWFREWVAGGLFRAVEIA